MAQLLFDRLIAAADDQGRLLGDLTLVKASCMPLIATATLRRLGMWLDSLAEQGMLVRYSAGNLNLIQILNWWDYQSQRHIWPSRWPGPAGWSHDQIRGHGADGGPTTGRPRGADGPPRNGPPGTPRPPSRASYAGPGHAGPWPAADGPAATDVDPEKRRAELSALVAEARATAEDSQKPEPTRRAAQRAIASGEAELARLGANGSARPQHNPPAEAETPTADAEPPEVSFDAPPPAGGPSGG
jgi:hypothetical protein